MSGSSSVEEQLRELFLFLNDKNPQVRQIALSNLIGHTPNGSPFRQIFWTKSPQQEVANDPLKILKLLCRDRLDIAHDSFRALINLSDSQSVITSLSERAFLSFLVSYTIYPPSILADLAAMLLSNLTADTSVCRTLLNLKISVIPHDSDQCLFYPIDSRSATSSTPTTSSTEVVQVSALPLLIDAFIKAAGVPVQNASETSPSKSRLHFLSSVFANVSASKAGRTFFLTPHPVNFLRPDTSTDYEYPLSQLIVFTEHEDTIRRGGVASTIKNCCFDTEAHRTLLKSETQVLDSNKQAPGINVLPSILLPLAGPEEYDLDDQERLLPALQFLPDTKRREPDPVLRLTHVESLLLLGTTRWGREQLRDGGIYEIVKTLHEKETDDKISETIERLVNLLKRDEDANVNETGADPTSVREAHLGTDHHIDTSTRNIHVEVEDDEEKRIEEI